MNNVTFISSNRYGSWTYGASKVDINFYEGIEGVDMNDYVVDIITKYSLYIRYMNILGYK